MPTRYFAGNSLAAFFRNATNVVESTASGSFDSTFVSNSIQLPTNGTSYAETYAFSATGTVWTHFEIAVSHTSVTNAGPTWMNGTTFVFRLLHTGGGVFQPQYWNGSAWTNTGSTFAVTLGSTVRTRFDAKVVLGSSFEMYAQGALVSSGSGWSGGGTTITSLRLYSVSGSNVGTYYSQIMIADFDTRDSRYAVDQPTALGALTDGTGAIGDVTEAVLDESTSWALATSGNRRSGTHATYTPPTGYQIAAVCVSGRGRVNGAGPTDGKYGLRKTTAGVNYTGTALGFNTGYEPRGRIWSSDPSTASDWTTAGYNDTQVYAEAA